MPAPLTVYGSEISYFTGKFEAYLRYKEIPYRYRPLDLRMYYWVVPRVLGATQYPSVQLSDGRWMSDTTPMILWLEQRHPDPPILPADPVQRYLALLIEDYADGWLWRPAMHYRWSFADDRRLAASSLAREIVRLPLPRVSGSARSRAARRSCSSVATGSIGTPAPMPKAASGGPTTAWSRSSLRAPSSSASARRSRTSASWGRSGGTSSTTRRRPGCSPTLHRRRTSGPPACGTPAAAGSAADTLLSEVPDDVSPLLREVGATHLEALDQNAQAHARDRPTHDLMVQGTTYRDVPTSAYRVWCLEQLRVAFERMPAAARDDVRSLLERHGCWEPLWRERELASGHDHLGQAPFCRALRMVRD